MKQVYSNDSRAGSQGSQMRNERLGACKGKDITKEMETLADRSCGCKEAKCARGVVSDFLKLAKDDKSFSGNGDKVAAAVTRIGECSISAGMPLDEVKEMGKKISEELSKNM